MRDLFKRANEAKRVALYNLSMMGTLADNYKAERDAAQARSGAKSFEIEKLRAELEAANAAKVQAEADARRFAELVDGGNFSLELQQRIDKYLEAK